MGQKITTNDEGITKINGLKLGLDMSKYTKLYNDMSNLIPTQMMQLINGEVFNTDFNIGTAVAKNGYIMTVKPINSSNTSQLDSFDSELGVWASISKKIILPAHKPANIKAIYIEEWTTPTLYSSNVVDPDNSIPNYSNNIMGGNGSISWD
jgi:hypothetical protein